MFSDMSSIIDIAIHQQNHIITTMVSVYAVVNWDGLMLDVDYIIIVIASPLKCRVDFNHLK